jgi:hypothetical protein
MADPRRPVWRLATLDRSFICGVYAMFVGIMLGPTIADYGIGSLQFAAGVGICGLVALIVWALAFRPFIGVRGDELVVRNPIHQRVIRRESVRSVESGYFGIAIAVEGEKTCLAIAAQKSPAQIALGKPSRSDAIEAAIRKWARE